MGNELPQAKSEIDKVVKRNIEWVSERPELNGIDFKLVRTQLEDIYNLCLELSRLSVEKLPIQHLYELNDRLSELNSMLDGLQAFSIVNVTNPQGARDSKQAEAFRTISKVYPSISSFVTYLNVERMKETLADLGIEDSVENLRQKRKEVDSIISEAKEILNRTRQGYLNAGVEPHDRNFNSLAKQYRDHSYIWVALTAVCAACCIVAAILLYSNFPISSDATNAQILQNLTTRIIVITILLTATLWSARNYRAYKHLQVINTHRQLVLETFEFIAKSADEETRRAVLNALTQCIASHGGSGFIPSEDNPLPIMNIIESVKLQKIQGN